MYDSASHWDQLHEQPRFRPLYPNDHVVRFLMSNKTLLEKVRPSRFLDVGMGAGRHTKLALDLGLETVGLDISLAGIRHARERLRETGSRHHLVQASMLALPFSECNFAAVLSFGVFYYGTADEMKQAISEVHRVLAPGGRSLVVLRTTDDYRFEKGKQLERNTFQLDITDTNEYQSTQHFLSANDVPAYFADFANLSFEKTDTTFGNRSRLNSDWLITAEK